MTRGWLNSQQIKIFGWTNQCKLPFNTHLFDTLFIDSIKVRLEDPRDKCAGKVSLLYAGQWIPVCQDNNNEALKTAICRELNCGDSLQGNDHLRLTLYDESQIPGLSGIKCQDQVNSVSKCDLMNVSLKNKCTFMYLKCTGIYHFWYFLLKKVQTFVSRSRVLFLVWPLTLAISAIHVTDWERLLLYKKEGECSGPVYGFRNGKTQLVREQKWGLKEGQKLCEYLQCGNYTSHSTRDIHDNTTEWWNKTYNCSGTENMLECESRDQPVQGHRQLSIQCDRTL